MDPSPEPPTPQTAATTNAQQTAPVIRNFGTVPTSQPTQPSMSSEHDHDLIDFLSEDSYSLETQSFQVDRRRATDSYQTNSEPFMYRVPTPTGLSTRALSPSSGSITSVYVQADPPPSEQQQS